MNCHALFAFIDARKRWEEQQAKLALKEAAKAEAAMTRAKKRCTAMTLAGTRCRCHSDTEGGLCVTHRRHSDKKAPEPTLTAEKLAAVKEEIRTESEGYEQFCRSYYSILRELATSEGSGMQSAFPQEKRELYNVAGAEMADEFIRYKTLGRGGFNDYHTKAFPKFREHIK